MVRRTHRFGFLAAILLLAGGAGAAQPTGPAAPAPVPRRIVSINACADQFLLTLADPSQIGALSIYAADPAYSYLAKEATRYPHDAASAESVIAHAPDLVLAGRFTKRETRDLLKRLGYRVVELDSVRSVDASIQQIAQVAALLGHPDRGARMIADIEAARSEAKASSVVSSGSHAPTVAVYQRRGYVNGHDTLTSELLRLAGFADMGGTLAGKIGGFVPLEKIVADRPDYLVAIDPGLPAEDQGSALLSHPALTALYPPSRWIALPGRLTVCAGPSLPEAIRTVSQARARIGSGS